MEMYENQEMYELLNPEGVTQSPKDKAESTPTTTLSTKNVQT